MSTEGNLVGVRPGDVLAEKYRVERVLGSGGMGVVVAAYHIQLDERVALKFLLPEALTSPELVARFLREARAAVKIKSEHVARVSDVGTMPNGAPYMVMEYLEGGDLAAWLGQRGPLPVDLAVEFVIQACVAVAEAHSLKIVHRDIKPANLFCVRRPDGQLSIKVLDFGISKVVDPGSSDPGAGMSVTKTTTVMGSPLYMSPEQIVSPKGVDAQTDIWSLGVVLFELLTAQVPFMGETYGEIAVKVSTAPPTPLRSLRTEVPAGLEAAVNKCLQADRKNRFRDVGELASALLPFAPPRARGSVERILGTLQTSGQSVRTSQLPQVPASTAAAGSHQTMAALGNTAPGLERRNQTLALSLAGALVVIGATVGIVATRSKGEPDHPSGSPASTGTTAAATTASTSVPEETSKLSPLSEAPLPTIGSRDADHAVDAGREPGTSRSTTTTPTTTTPTTTAATSPIAGNSIRPTSGPSRPIAATAPTSTKGGASGANPTTSPQAKPHPSINPLDLPMQ